MFSTRSFATHSAPAASSLLSDKSYSTQKLIQGQCSVTWKAILPPSGILLTYQVLNGEIHLQHLRKTLRSPCLNVIVCELQGADVSIRLKRRRTFHRSLIRNNIRNVERKKERKSCIHTVKAIARASHPDGPIPWWLRVMVVESRFRMKYDTGTTPTSSQAFR